MNSIPYYMVNEVMNTSKNILEPKASLLGTYYVGSDRYACVILEVLSPKKVRIANMLSDEVLSTKIVDENGIEWLSEEVLKDIAENETPKVSDYANEDPEVAKKLHEYDMKKFIKDSTYTLRRNGRWVREGDGQWDCCSVHFGVADPYRDPDF